MFGHLEFGRMCQTGSGIDIYIYIMYSTVLICVIQLYIKKGGPSTASYSLLTYDESTWRFCFMLTADASLWAAMNSEVLK